MSKEHGKIDRLSPKQAREILKDVLDALYPVNSDGKQDWDNEHSADTTDQVARIFWEKVLK